MATLVTCDKLSQTKSARSFIGGMLDTSADAVFKRLTVGMDLVQLEQLVCCTIPLATGNRSGIQFIGLAHRCCDNKRSEEVVTVHHWLRDMLSDPTSVHLSAQVLKDIHCFIGLINKWHGEVEASLKAMVSAAWIAQRTDRADTTQNTI